MSTNTVRAAPHPLDQFLQPQSMVTPGVLGGLAMVGTNALGGTFHVPSESIYFPVLSLALSFVFGLAAVVKSSSVSQKVAYYFINSIIIFSVANGSNTIGLQAQQHVSLQLPTAYAASRPVGATEQATPEQIQFFKQWYPNQTNSAVSRKGTVCLFSSGPRAGQRQALDSGPALEIGTPCSDGRGNSGTVVSR